MYAKDKRFSAYKKYLITHRSFCDSVGLTLEYVCACASVSLTCNPRPCAFALPMDGMRTGL